MMKNKLSKLAGILGFAAMMSGVGLPGQPIIHRESETQKLAPKKRQLKPGMEVFEWADGFKCVARSQKSANRKYNNWLKAGKPEVKLNWE